MIPSRDRLFLGIAATALMSAGCIPPPAIKEVKQSHDGRALGDHVCIVYSGRYQISMAGLEKLHPFDINKYAKIYLQLVRDQIVEPSDIFVPPPVTREQLLLVHSSRYLCDLRNSTKVAQYLEFGPLAFAPAKLSDAAILEPFRYATGGTILAGRLALKHGMAINLGGGYHHAEPDRGGGFCIYSDMPIAIRALQREGLIRRALIVDLDVHQGNGTARCIAADEDVFTLDIHEADIYPIPKEKNDLDVPLPAGIEDEQYLAILNSYLPGVIEKSKPDIMFLQAGVDSLAGDPLAHFRLTPEGIVKRDKIVFDAAFRNRIPIVMVLGGGYTSQAWRVQYESVRNLIQTYGPDSGLAHASR